MKMANCEPQKRKGRFFFVCFLLISFITFPYYLALSNFIMSLSYPFFLYVWSLLFFFSTVFVEIEASSCLYLISQSFLLFFFADFRYQAAFFLISFDFVLFFFCSPSQGFFFFSASLFIVVLLWTFSRKENLWLFYLCFFLFNSLPP